MESRCALRALEILALAFLTIAVGCGSKAATCVEGATASCACPSGGTGAQVCSASGAYGPCSCSGSTPGNTAAASACTIDALICSKYSAGTQTGTGLHKLVYDARLAGRFAEAICFAQGNLNGSTDPWLLGASYYEASYAWEGLGCRTNAVAAIEDSLRVRPSDKNGWKETCARCAELKANCKACDVAKTERIACPKSDQLVAHVGPAMLARAPSEATWNNPSVSLCIPIGLPQPGWLVVARVAQEAPDRDFLFHLAVDARTLKVVAMSDGDQRSIREFCELKLRTVEDHAGAPSSLVLDEDCADKMERTYKNTLAVTIKPPKIVVAGRPIIGPP